MSNVSLPAGAAGISPEDLPEDAVALLVWRKFAGPNPMTVVVTKDSFEKNRARVAKVGGTFNPDSIYTFEGPVSPSGRKTTFQFQDVISWAGNYHSGIIPVGVS